MRRSPLQLFSRRKAPLAAGLLAALVLASGLATAQQPGFGTARKFRAALDYYEAPHQNQEKALLTGAEARPQEGGRVLVKELKIETFEQTGKPRIVVQAPECVFDPARRLATSGGPIRMDTADGALTIQGEGFRWDQAASSLTISNRVHTVLRRHPEQTGLPNP